MEGPSTILATVGLNPLPVRIAAQVLLRRHEAARLVLLCSPESKIEAETIKRHVGQGEIIPLNLDDVREVEETVKLYQSDRAHLHYTGGPKVSSLAAFAKLGRKCVHSYLDPHDFTLVSEPPFDLPGIALNLEQITDLHGWKQQNPKPVKSREEVRQRFRSGESMKGNWLESCAYHALKEAFPDLAKACIWGPRNFQHSSGRSCEIDACAVQQWQFLNVSCTATGGDKRRGRVVMRAFEAVYRARQLGGVAARAAVLCQVSAEEAARIKEDLRDHPDAIGRSLEVISLNECNKEDIVAAVAERLKPLLAPRVSQPDACNQVPTVPRLQARHCIIATVGKNPLPVMVSLLHLLSQKPESAVILISTPDSTQETVRIRAEVRGMIAHGGEWHMVCTCSPQAACKFISRLASETGKTFTFNSSGGKKDFCFYAFKAFSAVPDYCYLSPTSHRLIGLNGPSADLRTVCLLDVSALARLHGWNTVWRKTSEQKQSALAEVRRAAEKRGYAFYSGGGFERHGGKNRFSLDAMVIHGYQLAVIQFHQDLKAKPGEIKLEAMETLMRARQFGGDLATVLYFSKAPDSEEVKKADIQEELSDLIGARRKSVYLQHWDSATSVEYQAEQFLCEVFQ